MTYDYNFLEKVARNLMKLGRYKDACSIYYFMADGDAALDGGYLGYRIGLCYENMGDLQAAKYWYGRALDENPTIERYIQARDKLSDIGIDSLLTLDFG